MGFSKAGGERGGKGVSHLGCYMGLFSCQGLDWGLLNRRLAYLVDEWRSEVVFPFSSRVVSAKCSQSRNVHLPAYVFGQGFFFLFKYFIYLFLEKGEGREKEGEEHRSVASCTHPYWEPNPRPRHVPLMENGTGNLSLCRMTPN